MSGHSHATIMRTFLSTIKRTFMCIIRARLRGNAFRCNNHADVCGKSFSGHLLATWPWSNTSIWFNDQASKLSIAPSNTSNYIFACIAHPRICCDRRPSWDVDQANKSYDTRNAESANADPFSRFVFCSQGYKKNGVCSSVHSSVP